MSPFRSAIIWSAAIPIVTPIVVTALYAWVFPLFSYKSTSAWIASTLIGAGLTFVILKPVSRLYVAIGVSLVSAIAIYLLTFALVLLTLGA
jgi:hypothetical protein